MHTAPFVEFLRTAWGEWLTHHGDYDALPIGWPTRTMRQDRVPDVIDGKLSYYSMDAGTPITAGTWQAITGAANVAVTGADLVIAGETAAFSLCRPPGHHASADVYGGYCFLNNAAIAAEHFRSNAGAKVTILDVDYHHGNGTQQIFYDRDDVQYVSLHGDPARAYPYSIGFADETGTGRGLGHNTNYPMPPRADDDLYVSTLATACERIERFAPSLLIVSLGLDTYITDPICDLAVTTDGMRRSGAVVRQLGLPTVVLQEGGYDVGALGANVHAWLTGLGA